MFMVRNLTIAAIALGTSGWAASAQDIAAGEASFRKCQVCHDVGETARVKLGPPLNGLDGRKAASGDFRYSEAMKGAGITWGEETFHDYIKDPRSKVPATSMMFPGISDDKEISDLWAYLKQFGPDGKKT